MHTRGWKVSLVALLVAAATSPTLAQGFGVGARTTFVRSEADPEGADALRLNGGVLRLRTSPRTGLELALDYRSTLDEGRRARVREYPLQASALFFPARTRLSPYLLGGVTWRSTRVESLDAADAVIDTETTRRIGGHAGVGAELRLSRRLAVHGDYRYTFIRAGDPEPGTPTAPGALPLPGTIGLQERMSLNHEGSMWTLGVTVNF